MNPSKFSAIAHRNHTFFSPIQSTKADQVLSLLDLAPGDWVLDIGCGTAELLLRLVERYGVSGVGVDRNPEVLGAARALAWARGINHRIALHSMDASAFEAENTSFAAALCIGSTQAYGGYRGTLESLSKLVRPGGNLLIGEGYWKRPPDPEYLAVLEARPDEFLDHQGNVEAARAAGLIFLYASVSNEDDWDHYEGLYCRGIEQWAASNPDDPDRAAYQERIRAWHDAYLKHGRSTLGFALYLFQTPGQPLLRT